MLIQVYVVVQREAQAVTPVVVQHHSVGRLVVTKTHVMIKMSEFLTQRHQFILSCVQSSLTLWCVGLSCTQLLFQPADLRRKRRRRWAGVFKSFRPRCNSSLKLSVLFKVTSSHLSPVTVTLSPIMDPRLRPHYLLQQLVASQAAVAMATRDTTCDTDSSAAYVSSLTQVWISLVADHRH